MSKPTPKPTRLELFAAFTAQFPLLTRDDLEAQVEAMRGSSAFTRMLAHARIQAEAIGLTEADLDDDAPDRSGPVRTVSGFHAPIRRAV